MSLMGISAFKPTDEQLKAINCEEYPLIINASAGTGKTEILSEKILRIIIDNRVSLVNMAVITFTNKAMAEMRNRISKKLYDAWTETNCRDTLLRAQIDYLQMADISTIHSFCERLLRAYGLALNISPNFKISNFKAEADEIIESKIKQNYDRAVLRDVPAYKMFDTIKSFYNDNSNKGLMVEDYENNENPSLDELKALFLKIYSQAAREIESAKIKANKITPNDLIKYTAELLQIPSIVKLVAQRYKYLMVDETQDTNRDQYRLIQAMIKAGVKTVIVGDSKQSIYKFRGADLTAFEEMLTDLPASKVINLDRNFRTDSRLLSKIQEIFNSRFVYRKQLLHFENSHIEGKVTKDKDSNSMFTLHYKMDIAKVIYELSNQCHTGIENEQSPCYYKSIGILCRTNFDLNRTEFLLKKAGIPVKTIGGKSFYKSKIIIDTYKVINAIITNGAVENSELKYTDYYLAFKSCGENTERRFEILIDELRFDLRENKISNFLKLLYEKTGILEYYMESSQDLANLIKLIDICGNLYDEGMQPTDFLEYLSIMIASIQDEDVAEVLNENADNKVVLTTIHRAKGLSFDVVILPSIDANIARSKKPKVIYNNKQQKIAIDSEAIYDMQSEISQDRMYLEMSAEDRIKNMEEELRVLYVAMTRARNLLILGTEKPKQKIHYWMSKSDTYASWYRWLYERDNGKSLNKIEK